MDSRTANTIINIHFPENVSSGVLDFLINIINESYKKNGKPSHIFLDFSNIKYIGIEGALAIICFCAAVKRKNQNLIFHITYPQDNVLNYLMSIGFFAQMSSSKVKVLEIQEIVQLENELKTERRIKHKNYTSTSVILPIETIRQQNESNSGHDFENMVGTFANNAIDSFNILMHVPHYNFNGDDFYQFRESNIELYKNIFQHSKSWGIASIHAKPDFGTTVCYYDIGIGFKASVGKFNTESESIEWALIDGNTSKPDGDNDGFGFTLIQEFVFKRNGRITIRSGDCLIQLTSTSNKKNNVLNFPGVQISYFIPV